MRISAQRAILSTDIPEQLLAAAIAHQHGDELPVVNREDLPSSHIDGVPVLASYFDNGTLYCAKIERQGTNVSTDGEDYINLLDDKRLTWMGDFGYATSSC